LPTGAAPQHEHALLPHDLAQDVKGRGVHIALGSA